MNITNLKKDALFLKKISEAITLLVDIFEHNNLVGIKDSNLKYVYASKNYAQQIYGLSSEALIGKTDLELSLSKKSDFGQITHDEDKNGLRSNNNYRHLKIYPFAVGLKAMVFNRNSIVNEATGNTVGIITRVFEITKSQVLYKIFRSYKIQTKHKDSISNFSEAIPKLTAREKQVGYLFMADCSSQDIADIINKIEKRSLTKSYIDKVFAEQLYVKFKVTDRKSLYNKMVSLGLPNDPPPSELFDHCSIELYQSPDPEEKV